ncbi:MAG: insulinase family protein [Acidobacteria bacterium]|nr:MAG: insulinase family protein [Acidobacteriota bacterium]REK01527.1 MAG: insulinase family protein [Acidobacteriota bacterium]REK14483.1 MAG: insulinase family protein [Acidobacteriota bacterium]REK45198.1 MAG: insulinase family protein [Acidobacteriota bacterium]
MRNNISALFTLCVVLLASSTVFVSGQTPKETPPPPTDPRSVQIPEVEEVELINGLKIVIVSKRELPLVTVSLLVKGGSGLVNASHSGLADITAEMITKGTELRSATQIAQEMEFLGASLSSGADWNSSFVNVSVMKDKLPRALAIVADSVTRPTFPAEELNLVKSQKIDGLKVRLKQPGPVWSYVASRYTYGEHTNDGTPESISRIRTRDVETFHYSNYHPKNAVLIFTGDVSKEEAIRYGRLFFGGWKSPEGAPRSGTGGLTASNDDENGIVRRMLVIDLPDSGQAAVGYAKRLSEGRVDCDDSGECKERHIFDSALVLNSILGGGYSARLNQEIRIKRGLSYGARSDFDWRGSSVNFSAITQTKNESAAEVAELIVKEIEKLTKEKIAETEMVPRRAVVTGSFGRSLQTNNGLAARVRDLYLYGLDPGLLNSFIDDIGGVSESQVRKFAADNLTRGDLIIVGDSKLFIDDLGKRFPNRTIEVIKADRLDLNSSDLKVAKSP